MVIIIKIKTIKVEMKFNKNRLFNLINKKSKNIFYFYKDKLFNLF